MTEILDKNKIIEILTTQPASYFSARDQYLIFDVDESEVTVTFDVDISESRHLRFYSNVAVDEVLIDGLESDITLTDEQEEILCCEFEERLSETPNYYEYGTDTRSWYEIYEAENGKYWG